MDPSLLRAVAVVGSSRGSGVRGVTASRGEEMIGAMERSNKLVVSFGRCLKMVSTPTNLRGIIATIFKIAGSSMTAGGSLKQEEEEEEVGGSFVEVVGGSWKCQGVVVIVGLSFALSALCLCCHTSRHKLILCLENT